MKKYSILILLLLLSGCLPAQTGKGAFLPDINDLPGWRPAGEPEVFKSESLEKIAGAETGLILEYGLNYAVTRKYYNFGNRIINVQVYTMDNSFGSYGLFLRHSKNEKVFSKYGNSCYEKTGEFGFWKQFYFIKMFSDVKNDTVSEGYRQIAAFIDSRIRSRGMLPPIMDLSENEAKNVRIFRGPLALSEIYYFSPLNIFFVNEGIAFEKGDTTRIILKYPDNNDAVKHYTDVAGILSAMPKFSAFRMIGNLSFSMNDKEHKTLIFSVNGSNLEISVIK